MSCSSMVRNTPCPQRNTSILSNQFEKVTFKKRYRVITISSHPWGQACGHLLCVNCVVSSSPLVLFAPSVLMGFACCWTVNHCCSAVLLESFSLWGSSRGRKLLKLCLDRGPTMTSRLAAIEPVAAYQRAKYGLAWPRVQEVKPKQALLWGS